MPGPLCELYRVLYSELAQRQLMAERRRGAPCAAGDHRRVARSGVSRPTNDRGQAAATIDGACLNGGRKGGQLHPPQLALAPT
eukprot:COSAG04_NODE_1047_length_8562_cov_9.403167_16_plen_83_part_00